ncbi:MAG: HAMP domain-containing protein, partial [Treponema sp.]|nr:HAMP domain-containing protein [Treponema sp.]
MKIGPRITLFMGLVSVISIGALSVVLTIGAWNAAEVLASGLAQTRARQVAGEFKNFLDTHWHKAATALSTLDHYELIPVEARREFIDCFMHDIVVENPEVINVWSVWDPDALEGDDGAWIGAPGTDARGRFVPMHTRTEAGEIISQVASDFEGQEFYVRPRMVGEQIITDQYERILGGELRRPVSIAAPIRNSEGEIVGVFGIDMGLRRLHNIGQNFEKAFHGTIAAAYTNYGTIISHFDDSRIGSNMIATEGDIFGAHLSAMGEAVRGGSELNFDLDLDGDTFRFVAVPVPVADSGSAWSFMLALPMDEVHENTYAMIWFAVIMGLVMIVATIGAALLISRSIARPITKMASVLHDVSAGAGDLTVRLPEDGTGETADASRCFNMTMDKIRAL